MEYLSLHSDAEGIHIESVVIAVQDGHSFRLDYKIDCDPFYRVRTVHASLHGGAAIAITSNGDGNWFDQQHQNLSHIKGCEDVDISATPFTNTLPIRRLAWQPDQIEKLHVVYFAIPEMTIHADEQRYTCVEQRPDGSTFYFEQISTGFAATLKIDADGLVSDYPGLFTKLAG